MTGNKFKYYIQNSQNYYYYIDNLNTVQLNIVPVELVHTPKGWQELMCGLIHNEKRKGNFTKITTPLNFVLDGKKILDYIAIFEGVNATAIFKIEIQDPNDFTYTTFFDGTIDFQQYSYGEHYSTANIKENTLLDIIEAKESVVYEIPLTSNNSIDILMDGINLVYKTLYLVDEGYSTINYYNRGSHIVAMVDIDNENPYFKDTSRVTFTGNNTNVPPTNQPFYQTPINGVLNISFNFSATVKWDLPGIGVPPACSISWVIMILKANGTIQTQSIYNKTGSNNVFGTGIKKHTIQGSLTLNLSARDNVYHYFFFGNGQPEGCVTTYEGTTMEFIIKAKQSSPATYHKAILPHILWNELLQKATYNKYTGVSSYLQSRTQILIPGSSLRKDEKISVQTTIADFLKYCYVNHLGVITDVGNNQGEINFIGDTFLNTQSVSLGLVASLSTEFSKQHLIGTIKVGYENIDLGVDGQINGKDEYNQTSHFTTAQDKLKADYDIVSPYIASMYAQELLRVKFGERKTTDNKGDNKLHIVDTINSPQTIPLYTGNYQVNSAIAIILPISIIPSAGSTIVITGSNVGTYTVLNAVNAPSFGGVIIQFTTPLSGSANPPYNSVISYTTTIYSPFRPAYVSITGLLDPAYAYNTEITPKHILMLHAPIIAGGVYNVSASPTMDIIKFQSGDKNVELSTSLDGITFVIEKANLLLSQSQQPFYLPFYISFETDYQTNIYTYLQGVRRYEQISFEWNENIYNGFVIDIESNPDGNKKQKWKLLCTAATNIQNLLT